MIISQDPAGPMPEPDAAGAILLSEQTPGEALTTALLMFCFGFGSAALWAIYLLAPGIRKAYPEIFVVACIWSPLILLIPVALRLIIIGPASLIIDNFGLAYLRNGRRSKQILWGDISKIELASIYQPARGQPIGSRGQGYAKTTISLFGKDGKRFRVANCGIDPGQLVGFIRKRQSQLTTAGTSDFLDNRLPDISPRQPDFGNSGSRASSGNGKSKRVFVFGLIALIAVTKIGLIFLKSHIQH